MRIVLLYPPPWKIAAAGKLGSGDPDGPPAEHRPGDLDADFWQLPYGLLSLAAEARRAGHQVKVVNLSAFAWPEVERAVRALDAELWGLTCFTANRRGVALVARAIRAHQPAAHIVVGGPHATALPLEILARWAEVDTVVVGEGEQTLLALADKVQAGEPPLEVAGTAWRSAEGPKLAPARPRCRELDELASPHEHFATHLLLTARGCPGRCTFCATETVWGHGYRAHSVGRVLDDLERALARLPVRMMLFKDETFTADRRRGLAICEGILARGLRFCWSCDTRADRLDDELAKAMRLAGCVRVSLGVESGSQKVLRAIGKRITPEQILAATAAAKRFGLQVRWYLMLGNRGETLSTLRESEALLEQGKPHQALFACLSIYPGTADYRELASAGVLGAATYFDEDFLELKMPFDASAELESALGQWFERHRGLLRLHEDTVAEHRAILARLGEHWGPHLDLGASLLRAGELDESRAHVERALELGHPLPGLCHNDLACVHAAQGELGAAARALAEGLRVDPQHAVLVHNARLLQQAERMRAPSRRPPLQLAARHDFELLERTVQPMLPGPLEPGFERWS